jgi:phosphonate transport system substrate-binding protein
MLRSSLSVVAVVVVVVSLASPAVAGPKPIEKKPLTFGMTHTYGVEQAEKSKALIEPFLTGALGSKVTVKVFDSPEELVDAISSNGVDLAWMTPVAFVQAVQKNRDVTAVSKAMRAGDGGLFYRSVFIVKADSKATDLKSLKSFKVAWVSPLSASGYLFPRELLKQEGLDPAKHFSGEVFAGDHWAVCKAVLDGMAGVGATFAAEPKEGAALEATGCADLGKVTDFKVIASSGNLPNEVIAHSPEFPPTRVNDVVAAFGRLSLSPQGKTVLDDAFRAKGFGVAVEGDFQPVVDLLKAKDVKAKVVASPDEKKAKKGNKK